MSTFSLLQLSAVKHRLYGSSFGLVIVTGWSSYLTSGREAEFTLLDMDDKQGWTLTPAIAADTREMVMRIPAASVGHRLEVTVRLVQKCPVDSAIETYTHWEVVERSSCLAFEAPPPPDVLAYSYELLSILGSHTGKSRAPTVVDRSIKLNSNSYTIYSLIYLLLISPPSAAPTMRLTQDSSRLLFVFGSFTRW